MLYLEPQILEVCSVYYLLGGQLSFSPVVVHSIVGDSSQFPAAVVFIVDIVCHVFQVLHVSSENTGRQQKCLQ